MSGGPGGGAPSGPVGLDAAGAAVALPSTARTRLRAATAEAGRWLASASYLQKWLVLGCLLGVIAGLGAVAFYEALRLSTEVFLRIVAGYQVPTPSGEGLRAGMSRFPRPWAIPLVTTVGALVAGLLVFGFAPEAEGHGTDAAIDAVHENPRGVRLRTVLVKIIASALTIGAGGSGGREGPTAQISAGFGSFLARVFDLSPSDGRLAVSVGIGSGIGSIFGAPLGGALLSAEILYRDDIEVEALLPALIASVIGYAVFSAFMGFAPLFGFVAASYEFTDPAQLGWYAIIGVVGGFVGLAYAKSFYGLSDLFHALRLPRPVRPALGGLLVGLMALAVPEVLGTGYGWIQKGLGPELAGIPLWIVLVLPLAKIVATSLSIGSGGSGGIFGPGMVIGAFTGAAIWRLLEPIAPGVPHSPAPFVVVGMMATFGSIARAPLAVMVMVAEMTGSVTTLAPAMLAVGLATLIVRRADDSIYRSQLRSRADSPAHRLQASMPLLGAIPVSSVMAAPRVVFIGHNTVGEAVAKLARVDLPGAPVVDERHRFIGTVDRAELAALITEQSEDQLGRHVDPTAPTVPEAAHLDVAVEALMDARANWVPVLAEQRDVTGILTIAGLVRGYRSGLRSNLRTISEVTRDAAVVDGEVAHGAPLAGLALRDAHLPPGTIVMTLQRGTESVLPSGDTVLKPGDLVGIITRAEHTERVRALLGPPESETD